MTSILFGLERRLVVEHAKVSVSSPAVHAAFRDSAGRHAIEYIVDKWKYSRRGMFGGTAAETSMLTALGLTYDEYPIDLSGRHLTYFALHPISPLVDSAQAGEGVHLFDESPNAPFSAAHRSAPRKEIGRCKKGGCSGRTFRSGGFA